MDNKNIFTDDFIANAIIKSEYLEQKYRSLINKIIEQNIDIEKPTSDLDPYYNIKLKTPNKTILRASYIGKIIPIEDNESNIYIKWSWSDTTLNKSSKINLIKILKYFLEREPDENSVIFTKIYTAFIQSVVRVDERFFQILLNALLHLMKHIFYIIIEDSGNKHIYLIKEIIES
jgi:hypothetical protein